MYDPINGSLRALEMGSALRICTLRGLLRGHLMAAELDRNFELASPSLISTLNRILYRIVDIVAMLPLRDNCTVTSALWPRDTREIIRRITRVRVQLGLLMGPMRGRNYSPSPQANIFWEVMLW
ncbi:unnamed protein product [Protopolystoma xenopodis]|uniref:Uncharacterized protein n=1 Tax=Protopolystoma xenopodis TaxID=117903 RepID=A0A3S5AKB1_9PLAT|nr:unnamed protein product [Protopolystoma xenopodis]